MAKDFTTEDAIAQGKADAVANHKNEEFNGETGATLDEIVKDARKTAKANHKADVKNQEDGSQDLTNDTSDAAKKATSESQLHPGFDVLGEQKNEGEDSAKVPASAPEEVKAISSDANAKKGNK